MIQTSPARDAEQLFDTAHNCAQAVLMVFSGRFGLDRDLACRLATGFGVGMSCGRTCGAVSGSLMVLGFACGGGGAEGIAAKRRTYALAREFMARFQAKHGSTRCSDLIGCDPSTPEGGRKATEEFLFDTICAPIVSDAASMVAAILEETGRHDEQD